MSDFVKLKTALTIAANEAEDTGEFQDTLISVLESKLLGWLPTEQADISRRADWQDFVNILIKENPVF